ncbi:hypothetical protein HMPREF3293_02055 [Christensenella minuta]|uniref:Uncharacterized protein n=1 Tax=Christensenella minuta TaxID=626937 RepID=A0A136Q2K6_9FIRM|nr:hypothetical protein HMPREF3293_02055 [Christensenella minuta]
MIEPYHADKVFSYSCRCQRKRRGEGFIIHIVLGGIIWKIH